MFKHNNTRLCVQAANKTIRNFYTFGASRRPNNDHIVPSLSENDMGSLAFKNNSWRKNEFWKLQFSSEQVSSNSYSKRGLFGNLILEEGGHKDHSLNRIAFDTPNEKSQRFMRFNMS
ncbi:PLCD1 [Acrasis kona]|uniref:PLCD1 n=1 Tax=Acrasis kona TaxID=1008807 RepID=A0AAW2Z2H9_9EUKA